MLIHAFFTKSVPTWQTSGVGQLIQTNGAYKLNFLHIYLIIIYNQEFKIHKLKKSKLKIIGTIFWVHFIIKLGLDKFFFTREISKPKNHIFYKLFNIWMIKYKLIELVS